MREWLYLLAGFAWACVFLLVVPLLARLVWPRLSVSLGLGTLVGSGLYPILQVVRITIWAIRTLREADSMENPTTFYSQLRRRLECGREKSTDSA